MYDLAEDAEHMAKAAREVLTRPADFMAWDERMYTTHGPVISWAERGSDTLAESNYFAALAALQGAVAHDESGASEARGDDVEDISVSHWGVGSLRQIIVRVYTDDDETEHTPAFKEAVRIAAALEHYPVLDESDFSEREYKAWEDSVCDAIDHAEDPDDQEWQRVAIWHMLTDSRDYADPDSYHNRLRDETDLSDPSWDTVCKIYTDARNELLGLLAEWWLTGYRWPEESRRPLAGQTALPGI